MIYNVTLCRQLIFEDAIEAESEEEAVEIAMERNGYDELNWHRNGPTQVICVEPTYDGSDPCSSINSISPTSAPPTGPHAIPPSLEPRRALRTT